MNRHTYSGLAAMLWAGLALGLTAGELRASFTTEYPAASPEALFGERFTTTPSLVESPSVSLGTSNLDDRYGLEGDLADDPTKGIAVANPPIDSSSDDGFFIVPAPPRPVGADPLGPGSFSPTSVAALPGAFIAGVVLLGGLFGYRVIRANNFF